MIDALSSSLKAVLDNPNVPDVVRNAEIAFDRPSDSYNPDKTTINLFLYDVRENIGLRSSEPLIEHRAGTATIRTPPARIACSYLVTVWIGSSTTGDQAMLEQHRVLSEVLQVFSAMPVIEERYLQGDLKTQLYPVPLVTVHGELMKNPAEFWSALGGKLRPSITLTATIAMDSRAAPVTAPEVSSKELVFKEIGSHLVERVIAIGGTVRDQTSRNAVDSVALSLVELHLSTRSTGDGRFEFTGVPAGRYSLRAVKQGYATKSRTVDVPGLTHTAFDIDLTQTP